MSQTAFDIVIYGATSFVGQIVVRYLAEHLQRHPGENMVWAMAGRSREKLEEVRSSLSLVGEIPLIVADAEDESALRVMCEQTRVVISTVGPYALYGTTLVKVCAETGTDYCDLTGETQWIKRMIDRFEVQAKQSGARILHCCGFDSIPSDLGVARLQQTARERFGEPCADVRMCVKGMKGGVSGGTFASMLNIAKEAVTNPELRRILANPYALCPPDHVFTTRQKKLRGVMFDPDFQVWSVPFFMAAINTRVVHRSNALSGNAYGENFSYGEVVWTGSGTRGRINAHLMNASLMAFLIGVALKPGRWLLESVLLPKPGQGPSPEAQRKGYYDLRFVGHSKAGQRIELKVTGDRDPGYGSTAKMLVQAGICLALTSREQKPGGFWTTATAFDERIYQRLTDYAGLSFEVVS